VPPPTDAGLPSDAGPSDAELSIDADDGGLSCPGDMASLPYVTATVAEGTPPSMTGGAIVDGEYVLSVSTVYYEGAFPANCSLPPPIRRSYTFRSGRVRLEEQLSPNAPPRCVTAAYAVYGASFASDLNGPPIRDHFTVVDNATLLTNLFEGLDCTPPDGGPGTVVEDVLPTVWTYRLR
jgi:hypothetical protein